MTSIPINRKIYLKIFISIFIFFIDRITKIYVIHLDQVNFGKEIIVNDFLNINLIWNTGVAFGFFSFEENYFYNFLTLIIFMIIIIILVLSFKNSGIKGYAYLVIFAGASGNLFDRFFSKQVPDFIDLHIGHIHWFVFNIADIFITLGVIFLIMTEFFNKEKDEKKI